MIKFKIFYGGDVLPADLKANEWSEQHPDAELLDFKYQAVERETVRPSPRSASRIGRRVMIPDIIILPQEDIHKLASGEIVSCPGKDGKVLIMSKMRWLADSTARYKKFVEEHGEEFTDEHQAFLEAIAGIDEEESDA